MHLRPIARIVFVLALAFSLSAPLAGSAAACPPGTDPGLC
jgi:hypothetical protein